MLKNGVIFVRENELLVQLAESKYQAYYVLSPTCIHLNLEVLV